MTLEDFFRRPFAIARFRRAPLGPVMDGFCHWVDAQGISRRVVRQRIGQAAHFNCCLRHWAVEDWRDIRAAHAERFLVQHLPRCRCHYGKRCHPDGTRSTLSALFAYLSQHGGTASLPLPCTRSEPLLLRQYLDYLCDERGLTLTTCKNHRAALMPWFAALGEPVEERIAQLTPEQVLDFFASQADYGPSNLSRLQGVLRSFLRFCHCSGHVERDLSGVLPPLRRYRLAGVPRGISEADVHTVLGRIDRTTPVGRRNYAIIQLLHTYGVRGGQVRALRLDDIAWRDNRIRFPPAKGGRPVIVPLTDEAGEALLDYLRHARPASSHPEVFLTVVPPHRPLRIPSTVSVLVVQALERAGIDVPKAGSHVFRHGFAQRMVDKGESLKTIADLLGHRHLDTTFIYTKVDLQALRQLPLDWPEVRHASR
jgi:integrase/recombinase XerD